LLVRGKKLRPPQRSLGRTRVSQHVQHVGIEILHTDANAFAHTYSHKRERTSEKDGERVSERERRDEGGREGGVTAH